MRERKMRKPEIVVVTGASAGVGRATVREFARRGACIGLIARGSEGLQAAKRDVEALGGRALACPADVSHPDQVEAAADAIEQAFGPIGVWVNNAMVTIVSPIKALQAEEIRHATEVTYLGTVYGTLAALKRMLPRNRGSIVQVGSALSYRAIPLQAPYCGAKFAIRGFTDSLRSELLHDGSRVRVTMVQMPALNTPQFDWCKTRMPRQPQPVPPIYEPEVAARAIVWAASHRRREVWVGSSTLKAIWANKIAPGLIDRYLAATGYASQETQAPVTDERRDNFWAPVEGDHGARGRFSARSSDSSPALWLTTHRRWLAAGLALGIIATGVRRQRRPR
jgi:NAD(P)-dependent dehydrogenase (short-subunit alcohol dehydrogenase family)